MAGIMTLMLNDITQRAKDMKVKELYLWTPDLKVVSMYKRQGWSGTRPLKLERVGPKRAHGVRGV